MLKLLLKKKPDLPVRIIEAHRAIVESSIFKTIYTQACHGSFLEFALNTCLKNIPV
jgi:hypothetical protein